MKLQLTLKHFTFLAFYSVLLFITTVCNHSTTKVPKETKMLLFEIK